jgi:hypothetical protein
VRHHGLSDQSCIVFSNSISTSLRNEVLERNEALEYELLNCDRCGIAAGEVDPATGIRARLHVRYLADWNGEGEDALSNLQATCSICLDGAKYMTTKRPTTIWLLSQMRRAGQEEQREVLNWLLRKFSK